MNKNQQQMVSIGRNTLTLLDSKPALWKKYTPVVQTVDHARTTVTKLGQWSLEQSDSYTNGHTMTKAAQKELIIQLALSLVSKLRSYARINKDLVLLTAIDFSPTRLNKGKEMELQQRWQLIHDKGLEYAAQLVGYEVNAEVLKTYQQAIHTFETLSSQRNLVKHSRATTTSNIDAMVNQLREDLRTLDDLIVALVPDADFVATYQQARQIAERNRRKRKTDAEQPVPVATTKKS